MAQPRPDPDGSPDRRALATRPADALVELAGAALASGGLPDRGGTEGTLTVTTPWAALAQATTRAVLDTGAARDPTQLRQLACDARILPPVLAGPGQPVDHGRATRTCRATLRPTLALRDRGCTAPGCDRPPAACHAHHLRHWADGGPPPSPIPQVGSTPPQCRHWTRRRRSGAAWDRRSMGGCSRRILRGTSPSARRSTAMRGGSARDVRG